MKKIISRFASYFLRIGKKDVDVEVRRLMLSYLNGIQVIIVIILFIVIMFTNLKSIIRKLSN